MCKENCKKKDCCKGKKHKVVEPQGLRTEISFEMSGTIVVSQRFYNQEFDAYELNEIFLCKEDVSKIMEIALFNKVATKKEFI